MIRLDGDGQHDPQQIPNLLAPLERDEADVVVGSRFAEGAGDYKPPFARRAGIRWFAQLVSLLTGQKLTDTTSGFQAVNTRAIRLFAADYPHDYPEVEAVVMVVRHRLRILEVPAQMRGRETGTLVDHDAALPLLRDQGDAGACSSASSAAVSSRWRSPR